MPTNRTHIRHPHRNQLSPAEAQELWLGPVGGSVFESTEALRACWAKHRDRVMKQFATNGHRPQAWWKFDAPADLKFEFDRERSILYAAGLLGESEREALVAWWRGQFERAWSPDFFHCAGPGRFFEGEEARRKHFAWADIPSSLIEQWSADRQARGDHL